MQARAYAVLALALLFWGSAANLALAQEEQAKRIEQEASAQAPQRFTGDLSYNVSSDFSENASPRLFEHNFRSDLRYSLGNSFYLRGIADLYYASLDRAVLVNDNNNPISWDFDLSINKKFELGSILGSRQQLRAGVRNFFPISDESRYEGIKSIPGAMVTLNSIFFDSAFILSNSANYRYTVNTYRFSPVSGEINSQDSISYLLTGIWQISEKWSVLGGFGAKVSRRLDSSADYAYNNFAAVDYSIGKFTVELGYENGGFTRDGDIDLWYLDQYRRIFSGSLTYSF